MPGLQQMARIADKPTNRKMTTDLQVYDRNVIFLCFCSLSSSLTVSQYSSVYSRDTDISQHGTYAYYFFNTRFSGHRVCSSCPVDIFSDNLNIRAKSLWLHKSRCHTCGQKPPPSPRLVLLVPLLAHSSHRPFLVFLPSIALDNRYQQSTSRQVPG